MKKTAILVLFLAFSAAGIANAADPNLIAHWKLDDANGTTALDSAGANNGTIAGNPAWTTGQIDGALSFDGDGDYVQGSTSPFDFENAVFTVSLWFKTNGASQVIIAEGGDSGGWRIGTGGNGSEGRLKVQLKASGSAADAYTATTQNAYNDNAWHHVAAVVTTSTTEASGNSALIYVDGTLVNATETQVSAYGASSANWVIGGPVFFNGLLDDVRIYDNALSADDVLQIYEEATLSPTDFALAMIDDALAKKQAALDKIQAALQKENAALRALDRMLNSGDYGDLEKRNIIKASQRVFQAKQFEQHAKKMLNKSIGRLNNAANILSGVDESGEPDAEHGNSHKKN